LVIDADMNIHQIEITDTAVPDNEGLDRDMLTDMPIDRSLLIAIITISSVTKPYCKLA